VRRKILKALEEEGQKTGLKQTDLARAIGVHRSVINRELRGKKDLTLGRVAELAFAMGREPSFELPPVKAQVGSNLPPPVPTIVPRPAVAKGTQDVVTRDLTPTGHVIRATAA
jgi:transcriptional regulator with XRE-family HTH domain